VNSKAKGTEEAKIEMKTNDEVVWGRTGEKINKVELIELKSEVGVPSRDSGT